MKLFLGTTLLVAAAIAHAAPESRPGEFVVKLRSSSPVSLLPWLKASGLRLTKTITRAGDTHVVVVANRTQALSALGVDDSTLLDEVVVNSLSRLSDVVYVEPNYIYRVGMGGKLPGGNPVPKTPPPEDNHPEVLPNDALFGSLWGMKNVGQKDSGGRVGTVRADIRATKAWALSKGSKNVVVGIVDTGIDYTHPDLQANIWSMPGSPSVHGYNAITGALDPMDDNSHGTHCAGTIGGAGNNTEGVVGVNWNVSLMGSKFLDKDGSGSLDAAIKAIDWAVEHGADVLSNSWGGGGRSQALEDAIRRAASANVIFIAAAGNGGTDGIGDNNDSFPSYPASYTVENVVAVAASNNVDQMSSFSNFGKKSVHLMAPGEKIRSSVPGNQYDTYSGTSMATPHVAGAAALLLSREPSLRATDIKARLISSAYKVEGYADKLVSGGRLDLYKLLTGQD